MKVSRSSHDGHKAIVMDELTSDEQVGVWGLGLLMLRLERKQAPSAAAPLQALADQLPDERVQELTRQAEAHLAGADPVPELAALVVRRELQELAFGLLFKVAVPKLVIRAEARLLERLEQLWDLGSLAEPYRG